MGKNPFFFFYGPVYRTGFSPNNRLLIAKRLIILRKQGEKRKKPRAIVPGETNNIRGPTTFRLGLPPRLDRTRPNPVRQTN